MWIENYVKHEEGTAVAQWLRCGATNQKVAGSIPDGVIGIFHWHNPSDRTMDLGSTQPPTEMSTRITSWGKGGRCVRLKPYHHPVPLSCNLGTLTSWNPLGHSRPVTGLLYLYLLKHEDKNIRIQNYNFSRYFVRVWNLVPSHWLNVGYEWARTDC